MTQIEKLPGWEYAEWRSSFCAVLKLLDDRMDVHAGEKCQHWLESEEVWERYGAYDAQHYYQETARGRSTLLVLAEDNEWTAKYFYMKYITF